MIQVFNVRGGLATNSSSSHSLIVLPSGTRAEDDDVRDYDGEYQFGWNFFTAASRESKTAYLAVALRTALRGTGMPYPMVETIMRDWLAVDSVPEGTIDHQSEFGLPRAFGSTYPSQEFVADLTAFLMRDDVAILGGNDNDEDRHPLSSRGRVFNLPLTESSSSLTARKDPAGFWALFNPYTGGKIRFAFTDDPNGWGIKQAPHRSTAPELVDLKITQFCPFAGNGCSVPCYQGSDLSGTHASMRNVRAALYALAYLQVFEIAIGGGEPTLHPDFLTILQEARGLGIVPNFTTRNLGWLRDVKQWAPIMEACGAFAYSAHRPDDVDTLADLLDANGIVPYRASLHVVMGTMSRDAFRTTLERAKARDIRVTLLGYKPVGRGAAVPPQPYEWWVDEIVLLRSAGNLPRLGIDTPLAAESVKALKKAGVPEWCYSVQDGTFSAYIDAVTWSLAPSSYDRFSEARQLPDPRWAYDVDSDGHGTSLLRLWRA